MINIDFVIGLPWFRNQFDSIWVIVDWMTKSAHFLHVRTTFLVEDYAKYLHEIVKRHRIPVLTIFDRGTQFSSYLW